MPSNRLNQVVLKLSVWIRRQQWLRLLKPVVPTKMRRKVSGQMHASAVSRLRFPRVVEWPVPIENAVVIPGVVEIGARDAGVNLLGYLRGEFGLAEGGRLYARALIQGGYRVALRSLELDLPHGWNDRSLEEWIAEDMPHPTTIVFVNPDFLAHALDKLDSPRRLGHRLIACWFWELETIPVHWQSAIAQVDGIMVASRFVEDAFKRSTDKPVFRIPLPVMDLPDSGLQRGDFGLEEGTFVFLCMFDFHSSIERKNPFAVIAAFRTAFPRDRGDVHLLIKTSNADSAPDQVSRLLAAVADDPRIQVRDERLPRIHVRALQRCCDAFVSLHRAEGFGLGIAEAMAMGKPVIATGWSGNVDFMDADNSILVDYHLVPVPAGAYPDARGARWAEPDIGAAAEAMVRIASDRNHAEQLGMRAARSIRQQLSPARAACELQDWIARLEMAGDSLTSMTPSGQKVSHP